MSSSDTPAIQDLYPDDFAHCFGCGRSNAHGHQLKSFAEGDDVVAHFTPASHHISVPGFVYGGLLASLADCHAMATAAADDMTSEGKLRAGPAPRYVTARLRVDYLRPTALGPELEIRGHVTEKSDRKSVIALTISAGGTVTVNAEAVAVRLPRTMEQPSSGSPRGSQ